MGKIPGLNNKLYSIRGYQFYLVLNKIKNSGKNNLCQIYFHQVKSELISFSELFIMNPSLISCFQL